MPSPPSLQKGFRVGPWAVLPERGILRGESGDEHLEPLVMNLLVELAAAGGDVVSKDALIETIWQGRAQSDEPLLRAVSVLRRKLGDDSRNPRFVENIPRRGYRLMTPVEVDRPAAGSNESAQVDTPKPGRSRLVWAAAAVVAVILGAVLYQGLYSPGRGNEDPIRTLAIFPFQCAGATEPYLCFGFSEELTSTLLTIDELRIIRRTAQPPGGRTVRQIAEDINVDAILTGSVQQIGDRLRIAAEVTDGRDEFVVLSETTDGSVGNVLELQEEVAGKIAASIVGPGESRVASRTRPLSFDAFSAYAQGQFQFERRSLESLRDAIDRFEETLALDPGFGPAYLHLAFAYLLLPEYDASLTEDAMYAIAAAKAEAGMLADPSIEQAAGTVFGFIHHKRGDWLEATRAFERALGADPGSALSHHWYSRLLATVGRMDGALTHARRAYELDPDSAVIISRLAITHFWLSELEEARRYFDLANSLSLDAPIHDLAYALYLIRIRNVGDARVYTRQGLDKYGVDAGWVDTVFDAFEPPRLRPDAVARVEALEARDALADYIVMTLWALLDEPDRAMATALSISGIGQDFETGYEVLFSDEMALLHDHPDFEALVRKAGLRDYWDRLGCVADPVRVRCPADADSPSRPVSP